MTALLAPFGLAGRGIKGASDRRRAETLASGEADAKQRLQAASQIQGEIAAVDKKAAVIFGLNVQDAISKGQPINIGDHLFSDPAAPSGPSGNQSAITRQDILNQEEAGQGPAPVAPANITQAYRANPKATPEQELAAAQALASEQADNEIAQGSALATRHTTRSEAAGLVPTVEHSLTNAAITAMDTGMLPAQAAADPYNAPLSALVLFSSMPSACAKRPILSDSIPRA
jgi:hypothetical protein